MLTDAEAGKLLRAPNISNYDWHRLAQYVRSIQSKLDDYENLYGEATVKRLNEIMATGFDRAMEDSTGHP